MIHICLSTDQNYLNMTKMCVLDMISRKKEDTSITFYILGDDLGDRYNEFSIFDKFDKIKIVMIKMNSKVLLKNKKMGHIWRTHIRIPRTMYIRFMIPALPEFKDVERVLYVDPDVLNRKDVSDLFHVDLHGYPLGMVRDSFYLRDIDPYRRMIEDNNLHNAGLILMDLPKLRQFNFTDICMTAAINEPYNDQTIINRDFGEWTYSLPPTFQFPIHNLIQHHKNMFDVGNWNRLHSTNYSSVLEIAKNAYFYHFHEDKEWQMEIPVLCLTMNKCAKRIVEFEKTGIFEPLTPDFDEKINTDLFKAAGLI